MKDIRDLPFDLYTRNVIISEFVAAIRDRESLNILDVGGKSGLLSDFLPEDNVLVLDVLPPSPEEDNYVHGNIFAPPFQAGSFDVVVSSDVFEHIPPTDRNTAVLEMLRLSKNFVVLGAPFYSEYAKDAEERANDFFAASAGRPHPWLEEHIRNGLPSKLEFETFLQENGYEFTFVNSNNLQHWLTLQHFIFSAYLYGIPEDEVNAVYRYYNENFVELGDFQEPTYRTLYLIGKEGTVPGINTILVDVLPDLHKQQELLCLIFKALGGISQRKDTHITNLEDIIADLRLKSRSNEIKLARLESLDQERNMEIESAQNKVDQLSEDLKRKDEEIVQLSSTLSAIQNSTTWIMVTKFHALVERLMPLGTRRRHFYDLGLLSLQILVHEGPGSLWMRGKSKLRGKFSLKPVSTTRPILRVPVEMHDGNVPLALDIPLTGRFISPINRLNAIEVLTGTYERRNANLRLSIREGSLEGPVIRDVMLKGSRIVNNGYSRWGFKPIPDSKGKTYYFQIASTGFPSAAAWYNPTAPHEKLKLSRDGKEISGRIGFQCFTKEAIRDPYELWILQNEPSEDQLEQMREECAKFSYRPKISIVTPVWNTDERWLRRAIESVLEQIYDNWELCIADGGSEKPHVRSILEEYAHGDPRIKVKFLEENKGISGNSNEALSLATGEYVGLLDHDDEIASSAIYEIVKALNRNPDLRLLYSDEDKLDSSGRRVNPFFKPDWSPITFLSCNYLVHFTVIDSSIIQSVGGFRSDYDGSQDYDLFLRVTELLEDQEICHIPKILYHWRMIQTSAASSDSAKPYAYEAARSAIADAMKRRGIAVDRVEFGSWKGSYRLRYNSGDATFSIFILVKDLQQAVKCINKIQQYTVGREYDIVALCPDDQTCSALKRHLSKGAKFVHCVDRRITSVSSIIEGQNTPVKGTVLIFMGGHVMVNCSDWYLSLIEHALCNGVGVVGGKTVNRFGGIVHAGFERWPSTGKGKLPMANDLYSSFWFNPSMLSIVRSCKYPSPDCVALSKDLMLSLGELPGGDSNFEIVRYLCEMAIERGNMNVYTPYSVVRNDVHSN